MAETTTQLQVSGIDHVVLHVKDLDRSRRFYLDVLGFKVAHEDGRHSFLGCGNQQVALFESPDRDIHAGDEMNHMALRLEAGDYEGVRAALEREGLRVTGRPGEDRCLYFSDPDGHRLQLLTPAEAH